MHQLQPLISGTGSFNELRSYNTDQRGPPHARMCRTYKVQCRDFAGNNGSRMTSVRIGHPDQDLRVILHLHCEYLVVLTFGELGDSHTSRLQGLGNGILETLYIELQIPLFHPSIFIIEPSSRGISEETLDNFGLRRWFCRMSFVKSQVSPTP